MTIAQMFLVDDVIISDFLKNYSSFIKIFANGSEIIKKLQKISARTVNK